MTTSSEHSGSRPGGWEPGNAVDRSMPTGGPIDGLRAIALGYLDSFEEDLAAWAAGTIELVGLVLTIHDILDGQEWSADTLDEIATAYHNFGMEIAEPQFEEITHAQAGCTAKLWGAGGVFHDDGGVTRCSVCRHPVYASTADLQDAVNAALPREVEP